MALLDMSKSWVGVERRADEPLGKRDDWYPQTYVRLSLDGTITNVSPSNAKKLAKAILAAANIAEPPRPRKRRAS